MDRLIDLQLESGNWLSRPVAEKDDLVQCVPSFLPDQVLILCVGGATVPQAWYFS